MPRRKKNTGRIIIRLIVIAILVACALTAYRHRNYIRKFLNDMSKTVKHPSGYSVAGIDVSQYQGYINWGKVKEVSTGQPVSFVFIRATAGQDHRDSYFTHNWKESKNKGLVRGAYHYYRPDENSIKQAENFIKNVQLESGDLPPVLDIEALSTVQDMKKLKTGLGRWIKKIEEHYGVRPIIYTSSSYFSSYLENEFEGYILWMANYNKVSD
ncbi:MAG: GH25 family lysozyme, partial [Bacteroidota bacterium]